MGKKYTHLKIILFISILLIIIMFPYILQLDGIKKWIMDWLSFSSNPDYKIAYLQLIGTIVGTFLSVYGALFIQKEEQRFTEKRKKQECVRRIYIELRACFNELESIFKDTLLTYHLSEVQKDDVEKFCVKAIGRKLNVREKWIEDLAGSGDSFSSFEINMIYKFYFKLQVIQQALETEDTEEIKKVYVPYICWFMTSNGEGLHKDIKYFMKRLEEIAGAYKGAK